MVYLVVSLCIMKSKSRRDYDISAAREVFNANYVSVYSFLAINGVSILASDQTVMGFLEDCYENGHLAFDRLTAWL